ncbi:hypothetical protein DPMN_128292 [Dreissena polymorpha]|uniref:Uncharacterized protein n=1 Tax=Dreissena polymorpha TaxID=45954 RepID=A0A9D4H0K4_DREPO|nr:hypothetical protein DPMN_128292 [Dreissena polymorpha]
MGTNNLGTKKDWVQTTLDTKQIWVNGEIERLDISINLKKEGNQAAFTFINGPRVGYVDRDGRDRPC